MRYLKYTLMLVATLTVACWSQVSHADAPTEWTNFNRAAFDFDMTFGAVAIGNGVDDNIVEHGDMLAAFVDGELRGSASDSTSPPTVLSPPFGPYQGQYLFEMSVSSNSATETTPIVIRFYDASADAIMDVSVVNAQGVPYSFVADAVYGSVMDPVMGTATSDNGPEILFDPIVTLLEDESVDFTLSYMDFTGLNLLDGMSEDSVQVNADPEHGVLSPVTYDAGFPFHTWNYTYTPNLDYSGPDVVEFMATGMTGSTMIEIDFNVEPSDDYPTIAEIADVNVIEDAEPFNVALVYEDVDNDTQVDAWTNLSGNEVEVSVISDQLWIDMAQNHDEDFVVTVAVTGGEVVVQQQFNVFVASVNDAPVITSVAPGSVEQGYGYVYQVTAADVDSPVLSFNLSEHPPGMIISGGGLITWTPTLGEIGMHDVTVMVTDADGLIDIESFAVDVYLIDCNGVPNGGAYIDNCGTCDNDPGNDCVQDCTGTWGGDYVGDECGVCNGPGAIYECGCADIPEGDCDCNGNVLDALEVCGGDCAVSEGCGVQSVPSASDNGRMLLVMMLALVTFGFVYWRTHSQRA